MDGPLFIGIDTHALSRPALATALEVFAANGVDAFIDQHADHTPTPVISHAILAYSWAEQGPGIRPSHFTVENMPKRLAALSSDPWDGFRAAAVPLQVRRAGKGGPSNPLLHEPLRRGEFGLSALFGHDIQTG